MSRPALPTPVAAAVPRPPYTPPRLTPLGAWTAVTLVISIPIGPGTGLLIRMYQGET